MDVRFTHFPAEKIRAFLVFFCFLVLYACFSESSIQSIVYTEEGKAVSIAFNSSKDPNSFALYLKGEQETPVLGAFSSTADDMFSFRPVIPLSNGQTYELYSKDIKLHTFVIDSLKTQSSPKLLQIYPSNNTLPENLLKIYLQFSEPMQETGNALDFIKVYNETAQKEESIFLELQSELWNKEHTQLTLWLDPGRIKTDLIPNKEKGLPIRKGNTYTIEFSKEWKSAEGVGLAQDYTKSFFVTKADRAMPNMESWKLQVPKAKGKKGLLLFLYEPMDAILLLEGIDIVNEQGDIIEGTFKLFSQESALQFTPAQEWATGTYKVQVQSKVEDLAGNNFEHLFDQEIHSDNAKSKPVVTSRSFVIED